MRLIDGLVNLVAGLGTGRDKGSQGAYTLPVMDSAQAFTAYKASSLVRRVIDMPAEDACREWREWQAQAKEITAIEAEESRLGVQGKVMEAKRQARLFGGAALFIGDGTATPDQPLDPDRMRKGGLKYLTVMSRDDVSAGNLDQDPASETFGKPQFWNLSAGGNMMRLHPSRLVLFHGISPLAGLRYDTGMGWGDSVLMGMIERLRAVDEVAANILSLVYEAKIDVIKVPDLMHNLQQRGDAYAAEVLRRMQLANTGKGNSGALIIDSTEEYQQKNASFGGLHDITDRFMQLAASAAGIPMTLLFEMSPGGMNATGDNDTRGYYDRTKVQQTLHMQPAMSVLDECLIRSALGSRPDELHYNWKPLWQPTAKERADVGKISAETIQMAINMGAVSEEAGGSALVNALTESGAFPGLEVYADEFPTEGDDLMDPPTVEQIEEIE
jgi:phage-related protein (TIGR01555 family)